MLDIASFPGPKRRKRFGPGPGNKATLDNTCTIHAKRYLPIWMIYNHHFLEPDHTWYKLMSMCAKMIYGCSLFPRPLLYVEKCFLQSCKINLGVPSPGYEATTEGMLNLQCPERRPHLYLWELLTSVTQERCNKHTFLQRRSTMMAKQPIKLLFHMPNISWTLYVHTVCIAVHYNILVLML